MAEKLSHLDKSWRALSRFKPEVQIFDVAWDQQGRLLLHLGGQGLNRFDVDNTTGQVTGAATNLYTPKPGETPGVSGVEEWISDFSVNDRGDIGVIIHEKGVFFISPDGYKSDLWAPTSPPLSKLDRITLLSDKFCVFSREPQSTVYIYKLDNKSLITSVALDNKESLGFTTAVSDARIITTEASALYLVDVGTSKVSRVVLSDPEEAGPLLIAPQGMSCDEEGRIFVSDMIRKKVFVLSPGGEYVTTLGGDLGKDLIVPHAVALRRGTPGCPPLLAVSEYCGKFVRIFTPDSGEEK